MPNKIICDKGVNPTSIDKNNSDHFVIGSQVSTCFTTDTLKNESIGPDANQSKFRVNTLNLGTQDHQMTDDFPPYQDIIYTSKDNNFLDKIGVKSTQNQSLPLIKDPSHTLGKTLNYLNMQQENR